MVNGHAKCSRTEWSGNTQGANCKPVFAAWLNKKRDFHDH